MPRKRLTIEFVRESFEKEGYILLSTVYVSCETPLKYICPGGHEGNIIWSSWNRGHRCSECSGNKRLTIGFVKKEFEKENYIFLTKKYKNSNQKLEYICPDGHIGKISWDNWRGGHRCKRCGSKNRPNRYSIKFVYEQFDKEGYILRVKIYLS